MITLITGIPGMGKTALCLDMMLKERGQRPLFVMGVPELKVEHQPVPPIAEWTELRPSPEDPSLLLPYYRFPEKSIVIIDECQRVMPTRPNGSKTPDIVAALSTHRHTGIDIWLLTQDLTLVDSYARKLAGKHIHIMPTILGRRLYEWPKVHDPENKSDRELAAQKKYAPPKHVFPLYKSAEVHTKHKFRIPKLYFVIGVCFLGSAILGFNLLSSMRSKIAPPVQQQEQGTAGGAQPRQTGPAPAIEEVKPYSDEDFIPRNFNRPESAPIYDEIRKVSQMPQISGCIASASKCICYDQQGSRVPLVQDEYCRQVSEHPEFNPYRPADGQLAQPQPTPQLQASTPATLPAGAI